MPVLTQEQINKLLELYGSGVSEIQTGDKRIKYNDPDALARLLADAATEAPAAGSFRTYATFYRNK